MNERGEKNLLVESEDIAAAKARGGFYYLDPITLEFGISPMDYTFYNGYMVSESALFNYIADQFAEHNEDIAIPIVMFDGSLLRGNNLFKVLGSEEFLESTNYRFPIFAAGKKYQRRDVVPYTSARPQKRMPSETTLAGARARANKKNQKSSYLQSKIAHNMHEMKAGTLKGGAGHHPMVHSRDQALAISYAQARKHAGGGKRSGGRRKK